MEAGHLRRGRSNREIRGHDGEDILNDFEVARSTIQMERGFAYCILKVDAGRVMFCNQSENCLFSGCKVHEALLLSRALLCSGQKMERSITVIVGEINRSAM